MEYFQESHIIDDILDNISCVMGNSSQNSLAIFFFTAMDAIPRPSSKSGELFSEKAMTLFESSRTSAVIILL